MSITLEEVQKQIDDLQKIVDTMKEPKMEVSRNFTGQYFKPYKNKQYRRMESENIPIWEYFQENKKDWVMLEKSESEKLEEIYTQDCILSEKERVA
jgi:hypothetical protein